MTAAPHPADAPAVDPIAACHDSIAAGSKSFALASRLLPPADRARTAVLYAWCRRADDAVDEAPPDAQAAACRRLEAELDAVYARQPASDPVLAAFSALVHDVAIPRAYPSELLAGFAMDAAGHRYATLDDLLLYAHRVAGTVGLMMCHLSGLRDDAALQQAAHLGLAMQLTNIARDVLEDWGRGRLYLPADLLARHGAPDLAGHLGGPLPPSARAPVAAAVAELLAHADDFYRSADRGLAALPWRWALTIRSARLVYAAIGHEIARRDHDVLRGRAIVPTPRKLALVARALAHGALAAPAHLAHAALGRAPRPPRRRVTFPDDVLG